MSIYSILYAKYKPVRRLVHLDAAATEGRREYEVCFVVIDHVEAFDADSAIDKAKQLGYVAPIVALA